MWKALVLILVGLGVPVVIAKTTDDGSQTILLLTFVGVVCYFLPFIVALVRSHRQALAIFFTDLFLGWTFLGWVIAFIWACTADTNKVHPVQITHRYET